MGTLCSHTFPGNTYVDGYIHKIYGYRYNWHEDMYEIDIVLRGKLEFYRGGEKIILQQDDFLIVNPGVGHASYPLEPDTVTLVLHFSSRALSDYTPRQSCRRFSFHSDETNRNQRNCRLIRYFAANLIRALADGCQRGPGRNLARSSLGMIAHLLSTQFPSELYPRSVEVDVTDDSTLMAQITAFISENYADKLMLQDVADRFHYNRTYISSLFKQTMGIGFHEYLTRIRFQQAIFDLGVPGKNLSQIALDNGFPDLKSFNQLFEENFGMVPKEYRARIRRELAEDDLIPVPGRPRTFLDPEEPWLRSRLEQYLEI